MFVRFKRFCKMQSEMNMNAEYTFYCVKLMRKSRLHVEELRVKSFIYIKVKIMISDVYEYVYNVQIDINNFIISCICFRFQIINVSCDHVMSFF